MSPKDSQEENNCDKEKILTTLMQCGVPYNYSTFITYTGLLCTHLLLYLTILWPFDCQSLLFSTQFVWDDSVFPYSAFEGMHCSFTEGN